MKYFSIFISKIFYFLYKNIYEIFFNTSFVLHNLPFLQFKEYYIILGIERGKNSFINCRRCLASRSMINYKRTRLLWQTKLSIQMRRACEVVRYSSVSDRMENSCGLNRIFDQYLDGFLHAFLPLHYVCIFLSFCFAFFNEKKCIAEQFNIKYKHMSQCPRFRWRTFCYF